MGLRPSAWKLPFSDEHGGLFGTGQNLRFDSVQFVKLFGSLVIPALEIYPIRTNISLNPRNKVFAIIESKTKYRAALG